MLPGKEVLFRAAEFGGSVVMQQADGCFNSCAGALEGLNSTPCLWLLSSQSWPLQESPAWNTGLCGQEMGSLRVAHAEQANLCSHV